MVHPYWKCYEVIKNHVVEEYLRSWGPFYDTFDEHKQMLSQLSSIHTGYIICFEKILKEIH